MMQRQRIGIATLAVVVAWGGLVRSPALAQTLAGDSEPTRGTIQVDPEVDSLLQRADQLAARKEFDLATTLWQKLLDESGHHLLSTDGERYLPLREHIFRKLAGLPAEARAVYRITADGEARGLLEAAQDDPARREVALAEVVRRFFLTSIGDDAAFELAGLALDRRDFVTASRLTRAIAQRHPDPSVPLAQVWLRQAVADAYLGDRRGADAALEGLVRLKAGDLGGVDVAALRDYLTKEVYPRRGWAATRKAGGEFRTTAVAWAPQPDLPAAAVSGPLTEHMAQEWPLPVDLSAQTMSLPSVWGGGVMFGGISVVSPRTLVGPTVDVFSGSSFLVADDFVVEAAVAPMYEMPIMPLMPHSGFQQPRSVAGELTDQDRRAALAARWRERLWQPTAQLLPVPGGLAFRSNGDLSMWALEAGQLQQRWQSTWQHSPLPTGSVPLIWSDAASNGLVTSAESILFGDGLALAASAQGDWLYVLEGPRQPRESTVRDARDRPASARTPAGSPGSAEPASAPESPRLATPDGTSAEKTPLPDATAETKPESPELEGPDAGQQVPSRQRKNYLAAYDQKTGKLAWRRAADDAAIVQTDDKAGDTGGNEAGFVGPPVVWNDRLLVPVLSGGTYALLAINAANGATLWKTPLGDEPDAGTSLRSASCVAVAGGDVYVVLGTGMVFALDARSGAIHWGRGYVRDVTAAPQVPHPWGALMPGTKATFHGWDSDLAIVWGNMVVVLASDHDQLLALDRRTGDIRWRSPRRLPSGTAARYCLGLIDRRLLVAGVDVVRAYDLPSGRLEWEQVIRQTSGRGALTSRAIYLPILGSVDAAVLTLDTQSGRELELSAVTLTHPEPLGNLVSDGERLWVEGANRLFALTNVPHQLRELSRGVAQRRATDVIHRARLLARLKRHDEALADVRLAHELLAANDPVAAAATTIELLVSSKLPHVRPLATLQFIAERKGLVNATSAGELVRGRDQVTRAALGALQRNPMPGTVAELLRVLPDLLGVADAKYLDAARVVQAAARAIDRAASHDDLPALRAAIEGTDSWRRQAALGPLLARGGEAEVRLVEPLLSAADPALRLAAAKSLVFAKGHRGALGTLIELAATADTAQRRQALSTLRAAAGSAAPALLLDADAAQRAAGIDQWKKWHATLTADLHAPIVPAAGRAILDRVLVATPTQAGTEGVVIEYEASAGREVWRRAAIPLSSAVAGTDEGHRLVLAQNGRQIIEFDAGGEQVWQSGLLPYRATSVERLPDGNTRVACPQRDLLLELAPDGQLVATTVVRGNPASTQRIDERRTLVALTGTGRAVEVTHAGETVWEAAEWPGVASAQRLTTGQTLVVQRHTNGGMITLLDRAGQRVAWQRGIKMLVGAVRDSSGNTVLADAAHLEFLAPDGHSVWSQTLSNITGIAGN